VAGEVEREKGKEKEGETELTHQVRFLDFLFLFSKFGLADLVAIGEESKKEKERRSEEEVKEKNQRKKKKKRKVISFP